MTVAETLKRYNIPFKMITEDDDKFSAHFTTRFTVERAKRYLTKHGHTVTGEKRSIAGYELTGSVKQGE